MKDGNDIKKQMEVKTVRTVLFILAVLSRSDGMDDHPGFNTEVADLFQDNCPHRPLCSRDKKSDTPLPEDKVPCCPPCSCLHHCHLLNNCCPDKPSASVTTSSQSSSNADQENFASKLTADMFSCRAGKHVRNFYSMIDKCPAERAESLATVDPLKNQCEMEDEKDFWINIPAVDSESGIIYRNIHCAECHGIGHAIPWVPELFCSSTLMNPLDESPFPNTETELMEDIFERYCRIVYIPPFNVDANSCSVRPLIDSCNVTKRWKTFSQALVDACKQQFYQPIKDVFKNIFCAVCNGRAKPEYDGCEDETRNNYQAGYQFTAILNYDTVLSSNENDENESLDRDEENECRLGQIMDPYKAACRQEFCPRRLAMIKGRCVPLLHVNDIWFYLPLKMETDPAFFENESTEMKTEAARECLEYLFGERQDLVVLLRDVVETPTRLSVLTVFARIAATAVTDADILSWTFDQLKEDFVFTLSPTRDFIFSLSLHNTLHTGYPLQQRPEGTHLRDVSTNTTLKTLYHKYVDFDPTIALVTKLFFCRQVRLDETEFLDVSGTHITVLATNKTLFPGEYFKTQVKIRSQNGPVFSTSVQICTEDYLPKRDPLERSSTQDITSASRLIVILSVTGPVFCVIILSVVFIAVYLRLRNQTCCPHPCRILNTEADVQT